MKTCKTCKYWITTNESDGFNVKEMCHPIDPDTYEPMLRGFEVRKCEHPSQTFAESPIEDNGFGLVDGSEYFACLVTAENFGCVRHTANTDGTR
jgi:hypothetical protein